MAETPISFVTVPSGRRPLSPPAKTDVLGGVEERLGQLANGLARQRGAELAEEQRVERVRIENEALSVMESARLEARKAPRSSEVQRIYDEKTRPIADLLDQLPDEEKPLFQAFVARRGLAHMADLETTRSKMLARETQVVANEKLEGLKLAAANGTAADLQESLDQLGVFYAEQVGSGSINESTAQAAIAAGRQDIQLSYANGLLAKKAYSTAIEAAGTLDALSTEMQQELRSKAQSGLGDRFVTDVDLALDAGANPMALRAEALKRREAGTLSEAQTRTVLDATRAAMKTASDEAILDAHVELFNRTGVIPTHLEPKMQDSIVSRSFAEYASDHGEMDDIEKAVSFAAEKGRMPKEILGIAAGKIRSTDANVRMQGFQEWELYDRALGGKMGQLSGVDQVAYADSRTLQRLRFDQPLTSDGALPAPKMSMADAVAILDSDKARGESNKTADRLDRFRERILTDPSIVMNAVGAHRGVFAAEYRQKFGVFALDDPDAVPAPLQRVIASRAADLLEKRRFDETASDEVVAGAVDAVVAAGFSGSEHWSLTDVNGKPTLSLAPPEVVYSPVTDDTGRTLSGAAYRAETIATLGKIAADRSEDVDFKRTINATIARVTDENRTEGRRFLSGGEALFPFDTFDEQNFSSMFRRDLASWTRRVDDVALRRLTNALVDQTSMDRFVRYAAAEYAREHSVNFGQAQDYIWKRMHESLGTNLSTDRGEPVLVADFQTIAALQAGTEPTWQVHMRVDESGGTVNLGARIGFGDRNAMFSPFLRNRNDLLAADEMMHEGDQVQRYEQVKGRIENSTYVAGVKRRLDRLSDELSGKTREPTLQEYFGFEGN